MSTDQTFQRRHLLKGLGILGLGAGTGLFVPGLPRAASTVAEIPLDRLDPFGPPGENYDRMRGWFSEPADVSRIIRRLWVSHQEGGGLEHGLWALSYAFLFWQTAASSSQRLKIARAGLKMARSIEREHPGEVTGLFWSAVFYGSVGLSRGHLDALQMLPEFERRLTQVEEIQPDFFYGSAHLLKAKMYTKVPPFPVSIGNMQKGYEYLEKARPYQEGTYAIWYLVLAEAEYLTKRREEGPEKGREAAFAVLDRIESEVCPVDVTTRYTYEMAAYVAGKFREAVAPGGKYDKYTWDPLLEPITELRTRIYRPKQICA